jgi:hypothetical protein
MRKESEESELEPGEVVACRYRVETHYRTHPLGELYCCWDQSQDVETSVLLQRLRREFALPSVQDRLFETRGSASLESPVIADILDYGEDIDGRPFLVTPWSDDASLDGVERPLGFAEAVAIVIRVAEALAPLHAQGMLHGGIEPASVLVDDQRELTGLLGFGLAPALAAGADRSRALPLLVSPGYAAPELITGQPLGPQADVYALGILLWELIFGQPPFRGALLRVLDAHIHRALPDFELPFDAPASFESTLRRMLAKRPQDRFADAGAVAEQLRGHLREPVLFQPEVLEATAVVEHVEHDDDDETVVFEAVRESVEIPRIHLRRELVPEPVTETRTPSRLLPKLALALSMCASLVLVSGWALERDRPRVGAEQSTTVGVERALASATQLEPIAVGAVSRVGQPGVSGMPDAIEPASAPNRDPLRDTLAASTFRAQKDQLYGGIERICTHGNVRRTLKLAVRVDARGRVEAATVLGKMGASKLGRCVERQAQGLEFPASRKGGYYVYTLRLRS